MRWIGFLAAVALPTFSGCTLVTERSTKWMAMMRPVGATSGGWRVDFDEVTESLYVFNELVRETSKIEIKGQDPIPAGIGSLSRGFHLKNDDAGTMEVPDRLKGTHFNPSAANHGTCVMNPLARHAGDLCALWVEDGSLTIDEDAPLLYAYRDDLDGKLLVIDRYSDFLSTASPSPHLWGLVVPAPMTPPDNH